ncbi:uncharacterized protein ACNS7B_019079 [Menidia menidia]
MDLHTSAGTKLPFQLALRSRGLSLLLLAGLLLPCDLQPDGFQRHLRLGGPKLNWNEARRFCSDRFTQFATIGGADAAAEALWVAGGSEVWIGLSRSWTWSQDSQVAFYPRAEQLTVNRCALISSSGAWPSADCNSSHPYICYSAPPGPGLQQTATPATPTSATVVGHLRSDPDPQELGLRQLLLQVHVQRSGQHQDPGGQPAGAHRAGQRQPAVPAGVRLDRAEQADGGVGGRERRPLQAVARRAAPPRGRLREPAAGGGLDLEALWGGEGLPLLPGRASEAAAAEAATDRRDGRPGRRRPIGRHPAAAGLGAEGPRWRGGGVPADLADAAGRERSPQRGAPCWPPLEGGPSPEEKLEKMRK